MQREERSLGELFSELSRETSTLVRKEVELAKTEITDKATKAGKNIGFLAVGGAVAYAGFLTLIAAVVMLIGLAIPWWLSALIVGVIVAGVGYALVQKGLSTLKAMDFKPQETIETLKEDKAWAKQQMH